MKRPLLVSLGDRVLEMGPLRAFTVFLFHPRPADGPEQSSTRWAHAVALAGITLLAAVMARSELNGLLSGMHPTGRSAATVADLSRAWNFGFAATTADIGDAVATWSEYRDAVGLSFTSPRTIVALHVALTVLAMIPAYLILGATLILALVARATGVDHRGLTPSVDPAATALRRLGGSALAVLGLLGLVHAVEGLVGYLLVTAAWSDGAVAVPVATTLWVLALARSALIVTLGLMLLPLFAGRIVRVPGPATTVLMRPRRPDFGSLIALRAGALVIALLVAACFIPVQMADVARRWTVSSTLAAAVMATVVAVAIEHHGRHMLGIRRRHLTATRRGHPVGPRAVRWRGRNIPLRRAALAALFSTAAIQLSLDFTGKGVGRGLLIPVVIVAAVWLLGRPLEPATFERGTREPSTAIVAVGPRLLGAAVFVVLGAAVFRASVAHLAYSGRVDAYLALALIPPVIGTWRLSRSKRERVGVLEIVIATVLCVLGVILAIRNNPQLSPSALVVAGLFLLYGAIPFYYSFVSADRHPEFMKWTAREQGRVLRIASWVGAIALAGALVARPLSLGPTVGAFAVMMLLALFVLAALAVAVGFAEQTDPPRLLAAMRIQRTPMIAALGIWAALAPAVIDPGAHDIRIISNGPGAAEAGIGIGDVWDRYREANLDQVPLADRPAVPLVLISSSGGGTRAATWTAYVLDCLFSARPVAGGPEVCPDPGAAWRERAFGSVAAVVGVSGGGLGLSTFYLHAIGPSTDGDWVADRLGGDYLSAAATWLAFVDIPRSLLGFSAGIPDRAELLERAWESSWPEEMGLDTGLFEMWQRHPEVPVMLFSGSSVLDACRFNGSVLDVAVGAPDLPCSSLAPFSTGGSVPDGAFLSVARDLTDFLCPGEDIRLSTAVLMAARFPVLSPMARVAGSGDCAVGDPAYVVDGGYFEGSGAATIHDIFVALQGAIDRHNAESNTCVVPFLIHIDNGYEGGRSPAKNPPRELLAPFVALNGARTSRMNDVRAEAAMAFEVPLLVAGQVVDVVSVDGQGAVQNISSRYARLTTHSHPGVEAPLGWSLSRISIEDLRLQLQTVENSAELAEVFRWFTGSLECRSR